MRYVCCPPPELNPLCKSTEGSETQEETRKRAVLRFIHPTMAHCAALFLRFRAKISNKHKNYLCTVLVTGASASAQVLLFRGSVPLWQPNREIPPHPRSSFSLTFCCFRQGHMKRRVVKLGAGSQNFIYNIGAVRLHKERRVNEGVFWSGM